MTTHAWFPIPVYSSKATGKEYEKIQEELSRTYETTDFQQNPNWTDDTHDLSLGDSGKIFGDCLLKQKKCNNFISFIDKCISEYMNDLGIEKEYKNYEILESWMTRTMKGKYAHLHDHMLCDLSGVYYYKTNGKDGNIMFPNYLRQFGSNFILGRAAHSMSSFPLEQGFIGIWPSMLMHNTQPNLTDNDRVSVSFNIKFTNYGGWQPPNRPTWSS